MKVQLIRKFAEMINGIDLSQARAGEVIEVSAHDGSVLMAEGWAVPAALRDVLPRAEAADRSRPPRRRTGLEN